jgi:hypothetical protein
MDSARKAADGYPTRIFLEQSDLGYSHEAGTNAFMGLHQLLGDDAEFDEVSALLNTPVTQNLRFQRKKALLTHLPPDPIIADLVASYFACWNWQYGVIERHYFDAIQTRWSENPPQKPAFLTAAEFAQELRFFPSLMFQVLAIAMQVIPPDSPVLDRMTKRQLESARHWSDIGVELLGSHGDRCCAITAVQAGLLRVMWLKNVGRGVDSWHHLGAAIRLFMSRTSAEMVANGL